MDPTATPTIILTTIPTITPTTKPTTTPTIIPTITPTITPTSRRRLDIINMIKKVKTTATTTIKRVLSSSTTTSQLSNSCKIKNIYLFLYCAIILMVYTFAMVFVTRVYQLRLLLLLLL